jgi:predicted RNA methylase
MNLLKRLATSLRGQGIVATVIKLRTLMVDHWFDFRYGLDTCAWSELEDLTIDSTSKASGYLYKPARILPLRKFFKETEQTCPREGVLVDFGSGKGRVLLVASEFGFREARGVEFAHELAEISRRNCARYKSVTATETEFETVEADASKYAIRADEHVFVFCNPFDDTIMKAVLANIAKSVVQHPRQVVIAYYNPKWGRVVEQQSEFNLISEFNWWGHKFALYSNRKQSAM